MAISQSFPAVLLVNGQSVGVITNASINEEFGQVTVTGINNRFVQRLEGVSDASGDFVLYRDVEVSGQSDIRGAIEMLIYPEGNLAGHEEIRIPATITSRAMTIGNEGAAIEQSYNWNLAGDLVRSTVQ